MSRYRVVFERPELEIEAESEEDANDRAYDWVCNIHHYVDFVEVIPDGS